MSFKKIDDKLRLDSVALKQFLTKVKTDKSGKKTNTPISGAYVSRLLVDYLARNFLKHPSNYLSFNKKKLRDELLISSYKLDTYINICIDNNIFKVIKLKGLNELTIMLNPSIYQYGYVQCLDSLHTRYYKATSVAIKRTKNKSEKVLIRIANNLKNAKPIKLQKQNVIEVNFKK